jgi:predicted nucleic acid-binding protein
MKVVFDLNVWVSFAISRDADDDYLLALSKRVRANYLVTGDKDLLVLKQHGRTQIVTFATFLEIFTPTQKS